jgi:hypothetical protein
MSPANQSINPNLFIGRHMGSVNTIKFSPAPSNLDGRAFKTFVDPPIKPIPQVCPLNIVNFFEEKSWASRFALNAN